MRKMRNKRTALDSSGHIVVMGHTHTENCIRYLLPSALSQMRQRVRSGCSCQFGDNFMLPSLFPHTLSPALYSPFYRYNTLAIAMG